MSRIRHKILLLMAALCAALTVSCPAQAATDTSAASACIMEQSTRRVLYAKNAHEKRAMASTTKIMTALLALEQASPDDTVTVSANAAGVEGSSLYLVQGETLSLRDLLYGLMLRSGNDAAVAIAEHVGGTVENFALMMNRRAVQLGALNTRFVTPNGLDADGHYTTAYDLALITAEAMENSAFAAIAATQSYTIPATNKREARVVTNKNKLLTQYAADGVKTGYTKKAGRCLVGSKTQNGMQLISVVLNCGPMFEDTAALLDDCFARYEMVHILPAGRDVCFLGVQGGEKTYVTACTAQQIKIPLTAAERAIITYTITAWPGLHAPVAQGQVLGEVCVTLGKGGEELLSVPICAGEDVPVPTFWQRARGKLEEFLCSLRQMGSVYRNTWPSAAWPPAENVKS